MAKKKKKLVGGSDRSNFRISTFAKAQKRIEQLETELRPLKARDNVAKNMAQAIKHKNYEVASQLAEEWLSLRSERGHVSYKVFNGWYKATVIKAYESAPRGRKQEVVDYFGLHVNQIYAWQKEYKQGGIDALHGELPQSWWRKREESKKKIPPMTKPKPPVAVETETPKSQQLEEKLWTKEDDWMLED